MRVVLASGSPRRRELLASLGVHFEVRAADVDEDSDEPDALRLAQSLALRKARAVGASAPGDAVLGADTIVVLEGRVFGKPADAAAARATLEALRNRTHEVVTGVAVVVAGASDGAPSEAVDCAVTRVTMRPYTDAELEAYVASGDPFDKSGAYAAQHPTFRPAASVEGCLCSVVGLPLWTARRLLREAGVEAGAPALGRCAGCPLREE